MSEYDLNFAKRLAQLADSAIEENIFDMASRRACVYLSRLSAEIALKSSLESAGVPISKIRSRSHGLAELLADISECEILEETADGKQKWKPASRVRSITLDLDFVEVTIGHLIDAKDDRISKYPNEIRYGENVIDFHPAMMSEMANLLVEWATKHKRNIRVKSSSD